VRVIGWDTVVDFFDRTLQALEARGQQPKVIGVGHELAFLDTIHPQSYDRPLDFMVTERGVYARSGNVLLPLP